MSDIAQKTAAFIAGHAKVVSELENDVAAKTNKIAAYEKAQKDFEAGVPALVDSLIKAGKLAEHRREEGLQKLANPINVLKLLTDVSSGPVPTAVMAPLRPSSTSKQANVVSDARRQTDEAYLRSLGLPPSMADSLRRHG